jgi:hypothetical protein
VPEPGLAGVDRVTGAGLACPGATSPWELLWHNAAMRRTTIVAEERTLYRLRQLADARGVSLGEVIREALEEKVEREQPPLRFLGISPVRGAVDAQAAEEDQGYRADDFHGA